MRHGFLSTIVAGGVTGIARYAWGDAGAVDCAISAVAGAAVFSTLAFIIVISGALDEDVAVIGQVVSDNKQTLEIAMLLSLLFGIYLLLISFGVDFPT
ncbi:hypothetical protein A3748_09130 [Erythrobacter sp. HI0077]|jgi:LytS/YehU family sensor histidine kinase|nr:hypothetical protein A3745_13715 [Erythrobacter sp. HI0074]KZZ09125.1 hypothetical protein A3748_09130 [Erythrobacter sp. HI0077]|tara:strand:- start:3817 stop:4110 length:294 start_codon:yes stop_codon:yes gene_type:complete